MRRNKDDSDITPWVGEDDGILFRDINDNGKIDNGSELFGDRTVLQNTNIAAHGFEALEDLDSNSDGVINNQDTAWGELQVLKGNGISYTLDELGITEFDLNYDDIADVTNSNNNTITHASSFTINGVQQNIGNYLLNRDTFFSFTDTEVTIPPAVEDMPFVRGSGTVHDLHTAIVLDTSDTLKDLVDDYIAETDIAARNDILEDILYEWAGVAGVSQTSRSTLFDSRQLEALEEFMGRDFFETTVTDTTRATVIQQSFIHFKEYIDAQLNLQTHIAHLNDLIETEWDPQAGEVRMNLGKVA